MILEIALGIVLAYIIIALLPLIVAGGIILVALALIVAVAAAVCPAGLDHSDSTTRGFLVRRLMAAFG
ncbi:MULTISPECIES: hypothetical protein [Ramlibacter]|uniref:Uncharacterized protein n=1 Tax=Ramlibacter pinisoli TaxID=2682844 RepID=A0A6N8IZ97_9BURK|nr:MULTISPECIES: hypothetical protein [Ramlibacter]MBA2962155.1 hypothetical protein [Ramlibacter sp. CGMCC 1.13660]MVQ32098.1 hypothetical protein [Ramlibacter pinisoli]